jgi:hypothetical protein
MHVVNIIPHVFDMMVLKWGGGGEKNVCSCDTVYKCNQDMATDYLSFVFEGLSHRKIIS